MQDAPSTCGDGKNLRLFYEPPGTLRLTVGEDRSYPVVRLYQAWPLSHPGRYLSLQDARGDEILMLPDLSSLDPASRAVAEEELARRYLTARIQVVLDVRTEFGVTYWRVLTNRGERDFVVQSLTESCVWLGEGQVLIVDVDGNRFEIGDLAALDPASRQRLDLVF
jgi:hypothetical protein